MDVYEGEQLLNGPSVTNGVEAEHGTVLRAGRDLAVTGDLRTLHRLTALEKSCQVSSYFGTVQTDIQPYMRRLLAAWMFQVCRLDAVRMGTDKK